jgi:hypothetical protein
VARVLPQAILQGVATDLLSLLRAEWKEASQIPHRIGFINIPLLAFLECESELLEGLLERLIHVSPFKGLVRWNRGVSRVFAGIYTRFASYWS